MNRAAALALACSCAPEAAREVEPVAVVVVEPTPIASAEPADSVSTWIAPPSTAPRPASSADRLRAREAYNLAVQAFARNDYRQALAQFQLAARLVPSPIIIYNVARCYEKLGRDCAAASAYRRVIAEGKTRFEILQEAKRALAPLAKRCP